ncbi:hypothetical protein PEC302107_21040 [Pectobacterium araliae]|uniref:Uncharacterized protein n=1 Tax=Pectobacterium araliae TaxID=3073862 RepID=A0AAN0KB70_9GAMM|nr:hypothetical protein PEC302110_24830 [Pectobacterium sp. MAFF 302110]GKW20375.1 hypothetical protein PEC302107_21040 [Pectobacterium carotovorum subsp. carotovorum]
MQKKGLAHSNDVKRRNPFFPDANPQILLDNGQSSIGHYHKLKIISINIMTIIIYTMKIIND